LHSPFNHAFYQKRDDIVVVVLEIYKPAVDTMYLHPGKPDVTKTTTNFEINLSAITNIFLSFDIDSARICLFPGLIVATQSQTCSNPTLNNVSSMINSDILLLLDDIL
jgi:hypothetical protein